MSDMNDAPSGEGLPPDLRFLKILVSVLAGVMIVGLITIIGLLVIRFPGAIAPRPALPAEISLPEGAKAVAITQGQGWYAVVTEADEILIFDKDGALSRTIEVTLPR